MNNTFLPLQHPGNAQAVYTDVKRKLVELHGLACAGWKGSIPNNPPTFDFKLKGSAGGKAFPDKNHISFSWDLMRENYQYYFTEVIPHEFCHILNSILNPQAKLHGKEFKEIGRAFGYNLTAKYTMDTASVKLGERSAEIMAKAHKLSPFPVS